MSNSIVTKSDFDKAVTQFREIVLQMKNIYNKDYKKNKEYQELRNDSKRRDNLYKYLESEIKKKQNEELYDDVEEESITVWDMGNRAEIKEVLESYPASNLRIIFNMDEYIRRIPTYRSMGDGLQSYLTHMEANKLKKQQDRLAKEEKIARIRKRAEEEEREIKEREAKIKEREAKEEIIDEEREKAKKKLAELDSIGKKKVKKLRTNIQKAREKEDTDDEDEEELEETPIDPKAPFIPVETMMGASVDAMLMSSQNQNKPKTLKGMKKAARMLSERQKVLDQKKAELVVGEAKKKEKKLQEYKKKEALTLKYGELSPEQKNNKIIEVTDRLRFELSAEGYSLDFINKYYSGTLEEKQKEDINRTITEIMKKRDLGMTPAQYKTAKIQAMKRSPDVANNLAGAIGVERKNDQTAPEYIDAVSNTANNLAEGMSPSMTLEEQKAQLETNYQSVSENIRRAGDDISMPRVIYDLMREYGVADTIRDISGMILPAIVLTASGYKDVLKKKLGGSVPNPIYISKNLIQRGYKNLAKFVGGEPSDDKKQEPDKKDDEPDRKHEPDKKEGVDAKQDPEADSQGIRITDSDDVLDFREEPRMPRFTAEEAAIYKEKIKNVGVGSAAIGIGVQSFLNNEITTKPVSSVIDSQNIIREKTEPKGKGKRSEGGRRKYSPNIIYPDDEILEPTENQLLRSEYNLAKFDFINPDNVGGNNSNGDNPLYKANDNELAIRFYDWKNMVIEKENEFVKQLPPKVSNKIIKQFRRSFVEPAEPRQTRLNYMIHDDTQFAPFNSPYSGMTENTGTNPFIQTSVLYGSVP